MVKLNSELSQQFYVDNAVVGMCGIYAVVFVIILFRFSNDRHFTQKI